MNQVFRVVITLVVMASVTSAQEGSSTQNSLQWLKMPSWSGSTVTWFIGETAPLMFIDDGLISPQHNCSTNITKKIEVGRDTFSYFDFYIDSLTQTLRIDLSGATIATDYQKTIQIEYFAQLDQNTRTNAALLTINVDSLCYSWLNSNLKSYIDYSSASINNGNDVSVAVMGNKFEQSVVFANSVAISKNKPSYCGQVRTILISNPQSWLSIDSFKNKIVINSSDQNDKPGVYTVTIQQVLIDFEGVSDQQQIQETTSFTVNLLPSNKKSSDQDIMNGVIDNMEKDGQHFQEFFVPYQINDYLLNGDLKQTERVTQSDNVPTSELENQSNFDTKRRLESCNLTDTSIQISFGNTYLTLEQSPQFTKDYTYFEPRVIHRVQASVVSGHTGCGEIVYEVYSTTSTIQGNKHWVQFRPYGPFFIMYNEVNQDEEDVTITIKASIYGMASVQFGYYKFTARGLHPPCSQVYLPLKIDAPTSTTPVYELDNHPFPETRFTWPVPPGFVVKGAQSCKRTDCDYTFVANPPFDSNYIQSAVVNATGITLTKGPQTFQTEVTYTITVTATLTTKKNKWTTGVNGIQANDYGFDIYTPVLEDMYLKQRLRGYNLLLEPSQTIVSCDFDGGQCEGKSIIVSNDLVEYNLQNYKTQYETNDWSYLKRVDGSERIVLTPDVQEQVTYTTSWSFQIKIKLHCDLVSHTITYLSSSENLAPIQVTADLGYQQSGEIDPGTFSLKQEVCDDSLITYTLFINKNGVDGNLRLQDQTAEIQSMFALTSGLNPKIQWTISPSNPLNRAHYVLSIEASFKRYDGNVVVENSNSQSITFWVKQPCSDFTEDIVWDSTDHLTTTFFYKMSQPRAYTDWIRLENKGQMYNTGYHFQLFPCRPEDRVDTVTITSSIPNRIPITFVTESTSSDYWLNKYFSWEKNDIDLSISTAEVTVKYKAAFQTKDASGQAREQSKEITFIINVSQPTCEETFEEVQLNVPGANSVETSCNQGKSGQQYIFDPNKVISVISTSGICKAQDISEISIYVGDPEQQARLFQSNQNYVRLVQNQQPFDFSNGLPIEYFIAPDVAYVDQLHYIQVQLVLKHKKYTDANGITTYQTVQKTTSWTLKEFGPICEEINEEVVYIDITYKAHYSLYYFAPLGTQTFEITQYWALSDQSKQPTGAQFFELGVYKLLVDQTNNKVCGPSNIKFEFSSSYTQVAGSQTDMSPFANTFMQNFFSFRQDLNTGEGVVGWNYDNTVYDTAKFTVVITQYITNNFQEKETNHQAAPLYFILNIEPPPCDLTPESIYMSAEIDVKQYAYNIYGEKQYAQFGPYSISNTFACEDPDIEYDFLVNPTNENNLVNFDNISRTFSWQSNNEADEGYYYIDLIGIIRRQYPKEHITKAATFQLTVYHICNNPATELMGYPENGIITFNFKAGQEETIPLVQTLYFSDSAENACWEYEWTYALFNDLDSNEIISEYRNQELEISYSFHKKSRRFEFFAFEDASSQYFKFRLEVYRKNGSKLINLYITVNLFDKLTSILENLKPNNYAPVFEFGSQLNNTVVNIKELGQNQITWGASSDGDGEEITINFSIAPTSPYIQFIQASNSLKLNFIGLFSDAEQKDLYFSVSIQLMDDNYFPRLSLYQIQIFVPKTIIEEAQANENYQKELTEKYEKAIKGQIVKPGSINQISVSDTGELKLTFSEPLPDSIDPEEIARDFLIIRFIPHTEIPPEKQRFKTKLIKASTTQFLIQIEFQNPMFISSETKLNLDEIEVTMLKPLYQEIITEIPTQAESQEKAQQVKDLAKTVEVGSTAILATSLFTNLLLRASISQLWGMINAIQIIAYLTFLNVYFPQNVSVFFEFLIDLSSFDILPVDDIVASLFPFIDQVSEKAIIETRRLAKKGGGSKNRSDLEEGEEDDEKTIRIEETKVQLSKVLLTSLLIFILVPLMCCMWVLKALQKKIKEIFNTIYYAIFFNQSSRFILESYTPLMQSKLERLFEGLLWKGNLLVFLNLITVFSTIGYILFPLIVTIYFTIRLESFRDKKFLAYWGEIMSNLSWRRKSSAYFVMIFCYRRLFSAMLVVLLVETTWAQICLTILINQSVIITVGLSSPFKFKSEMILELINEVNIMFCSYHLFLFTQFVPDPDMRSTVGTSMIIFTSLNIILNIGLMLYSTLKNAYKSTKMQFMRYKKVQKTKIKKATGISVPISKQDIDEDIFKNLDVIHAKTKPYIKSVHHKLAPVIDPALAHQLRQEEEERIFEEQSRQMQERVAQIKSEWIRLAKEKQEEQKELDEIMEVSEYSKLSKPQSVLSISEKSQLTQHSERRYPPVITKAVKVEETKRELKQERRGLIGDNGQLVTLENLQGYDKDLVFDLYLQRERDGIPYFKEDTQLL